MPEPAPSGDPDATRGISRRLVLLLAVATGAAAADLYYAQPLLHTLGRAFAVGAATTGLLVTIGQIGFVLGLGFLVPLGDLVERRRLIVLALTALAAGEAVSAAAPGLAVFAAATLFVGAATFVAQVIVPLSSQLAAPHERGKVVGTVMSGLLLGILLSRTLSGVIASLFGWRTVFGCAAVAMLALAAVLHRALPRLEPTSDLSYRAALASVLTLIRTEPVLRQRMVLGGASFGAFSVLWTSIAFLLSGVHGSPYHLGNATIGLFGLAGVAGAGSAQVAGRLADRGRAGVASGAFLTVMLASWLLLDLGGRSVVVLILGIMVLDLGAQGIHISNQSTIYRLRPDARSRITTAYMLAFFAGGVLCSSVTGALYSTGGWAAVCAFGALVSLAGVVAWLATAARVGRTAQAERSPA